MKVVGIVFFLALLLLNCIPPSNGLNLDYKAILTGSTWIEEGKLDCSGGLGNAGKILLDFTDIGKVSILTYDAIENLGKRKCTSTGNLTSGVLRSEFRQWAETQNEYRPYMIQDYHVIFTTDKGIVVLSISEDSLLGTVSDSASMAQRFVRL